MPKSWKYDQNGSPNRSQIDENSRFRRGYVFGEFLGRQMVPAPDAFGILLMTIFGQKIKKTEKNEYGHRALSRSAPRTQKKNDFWEARKTSCFFDGFFIENGLLLETLFNERTIQKSMLILNPKKSWFLMKIQCQNCLSFCIFFFGFFKMPQNARSLGPQMWFLAPGRNFYLTVSAKAKICYPRRNF